ncbi:MAG TPA: hypothetical protein VGQ58_06455 [Candidatus Limnocylindrales bacterium]|nr:hypothetical protein [Candidatus Limnocylindrales bacterium]
MIQLAELLAIAASVALVLAIVIVVRRGARLIADTRDTERFKRRVADLATRVDQSLEGVAGRIDAVRRHTTGAEDIGENIAAAREAVARYETEARALRGPAGAHEIRDAIVGELGRAARALEMADHGCAILTSARIGSRELEAQTSIKRGYLNVLHAREAIARHAARTTALGKRETGGLFERRA